MAARSESGGWSFGGGVSIWQGGHLATTRGRVDHNDDPSWRGWHAAEFTQQPQPQLQQRPSSPQSFPALLTLDTDPNLSSTLCMVDLEPWMDHEYASQVVHLMGWDKSSNTNGGQNGPVTIKIPPPPPDAVPVPNNPGYCLLTFPSAAQAANVLASLHTASSENNPASPLLMPNSSRPFNLQWANSSQLPPVNAATASVGLTPSGGAINGISGSAHHAVSANQGPQREFSIFVGDLAPETSNSDLVAVFRNPVLGLRNDREPKFIRPFYSCKSAKIMLDPVTGVSRGYGFVRFTEEADQQRALIEMHGLYCLSRPMRVSPATAKFKPNQSVPAGATFSAPSQSSPITLTFPATTTTSQIQTRGNERDTCGVNMKASGNVIRSVSSPVAAVISSTAISNNSNSSNASSTPTSAAVNGKRNANVSSPSSRSSGTSASDRPATGQGDMPHMLAQFVQLASGDSPLADENSNEKATSLTSGIQSYPSSSSVTSQPPPYTGQPSTYGTIAGVSNAVVGAQTANLGEAGGTYDEVWTHQAQARAILGNLIGPNGEQLTSTDPYNTTVFVGGLSPLISEETLRTFFAPFGDIHYVKVPLGKHCGFVQFVRKADAERAIERMQGFPIGGSRIRLSWGRSQYKAAQAAAQAAQAAQAEQTARMNAAAGAAGTNAQNSTSLHISPEQALQLLQSLGYNSAVTNPSSGINQRQIGGLGSPASFGSGPSASTFGGAMGNVSENAYGFPSPDSHQRPEFSSFSSFSSTHSPFTAQDLPHHPLTTPSPSQPLPHPSQSYAPGFGPSPSSASGRYSDTNSPHSSATDSSSGSSVRFSGVASSGFPSAAFLDNPNAAFQVSDILRHDSQTFQPRMSASMSQPQLLPQSHDSCRRASPSQQQVQNLRDDTSGDFMQDINGTLASLDLGERYSRGAIGSEHLRKDAFSLVAEGRSLPTSVSAPLRTLTSPKQRSGGSPESS